MEHQIISKIYSPDQHILIAEVFDKDGTVYIRVKKSGKNMIEDLSLDDFLALVFRAVKSKSA